MSERKIPALTTISPDFVGITQQLVAALEKSPVWRDKLRSSVGETILEMIAAIGELDQFAIERLLQEAFPETARLDSSIYAAMKSQGTRLKRKTCGVTVLPLNTEPFVAGNPTNTETFLKRTTNTNTLIIPPYTMFNTPLGTMFNRYQITFNAGSFFGYQTRPLNGGETPPEAIQLFQGRVEERHFLMKGEDFASIISSESNFSVSDEDVVVTVNNASVPRTTQPLWGFTVNYGAWQDITTSKGQLHVLFGTQQFGYKPDAGALCTVKYVITKGLSGNGSFPTKKISCTTFPQIDSNAECLIRVGNNSSATLISGGTDQLDTSYYRALGSQLFAADNGNKAVTEQDYSAIVKTQSGVSDAIVFPQSALNPDDLRYMNVAKICTYPKLLSAAFDTLLDSVNSKSMMSMNFYRNETSGSRIALEPAFVNVYLEAEVYCSPNSDLLKIRDFHIQPAIQKLLDIADGSTGTQASKINRKITVSDFIDTIKQAHPNIDYVKLINPDVDVVVKPIIEAANIDLVSAASSFSAGDVYYYCFALKTPEGKTKSTSPQSVVVPDSNTAVSIRLSLPQNYANQQWSDIFVYRGTSINTLLKLDVDVSDFLVEDNKRTFLLTDTNTFTTDTDLIPPDAKDTTMEKIVVLPAGWNTQNNITMFNTERSFNFVV